MNYDFENPTRLITGEGCVLQNSGVFAALGKRCLIVTGKSSARRSGALDDLEKALDKEKIAYKIYDGVEPNPLLESCAAAADMAREFGAEFVVGIGGGSPLDAAKAIAVFIANPMPPMDIYKYGWKNSVLPIVAIGTTAGTGSEVVSYAVLTTPEGLKNSIGHVQCYPTAAFGDPRYTWSLPLRFTISTGLDALSHALEGFFNVKANDMSDLFAIEAVRVLYPALRSLEGIGEQDEVPHDLREQLYYGSLLAGMTLARCGTCYCHRLGYFLSERYDVPHGTACAVYLPDFLHRARKLMKDKTLRLLDRAGCTLDELCGLIQRLNNFTPTIKLDAAAIEVIVARGVGAPNFVNTAPAGYTAEEARELLSGIFGE